jgi:hypothetical protein
MLSITFERGIPMQYIKDRHTYMDTRREYDKKMKRELIGGIVVMVVAFGMMLMSLLVLD